MDQEEEESLSSCMDGNEHLPYREMQMLDYQLVAEDPIEQISFILNNSNLALNYNSNGKSGGGNDNNCEGGSIKLRTIFNSPVVIPPRRRVLRSNMNDSGNN